MKRIVAALTLAVLLVTGIAGCGSKAPAVPKMTELRIAVIPSEDINVLMNKYGVVFTFLEKKLGVTVKPYLVSDYAGVVEAMRAGKLDLALYGPFSYVLANQTAGAQVFQCGVLGNGQNYYNSLIITRKDSGINTLADLKGHTFSFVDPASTSGYLVPRYTMKKAGLDSEKDLKNPMFAGGHDASGLAVMNKKVDAGAIASDTYQQMVDNKLIDPNVIRIISTSENLPLSPWAFSRDLSQENRDKIIAAFTAMETEAPDAMKALNVQKWVPMADSDYDIVRNIAKELNLDITKLK